MIESLRLLRDRMLLSSPLVRFIAEHGFLTMARVNRMLGLRKNGKTTVMFHPARAGSQVLAGQLAQHPDIFWDNELFWTKRTAAYQALGEKRFKPMNITALSQHKTLKPWYGFEIKPRDFEIINLPPSEFCAGMKAQGLERCILLNRNNDLRRYLSLLVLKKSRKTHFRTSEKPKRQAVTVDVDEFQRYSEMRRLFWVALEQNLSGLEVLRLSYEEHIENDPSIAYRMVCEFLELEPVAVEVKLRKGNPYPIQELIENHAEVVSRLERTKYAWMLE